MFHEKVFSLARKWLGMSFAREKSDLKEIFLPPLSQQESCMRFLV
jgi:hypothetical protein